MGKNAKEKLAEVNQIEAETKLFELSKAKNNSYGKFHNENDAEYANMRESLYSMVERTTFQGVPNIMAVETRLFMRIIWAITIVAFTGLTWYFLSMAILNYYQYEVNTVIEIERGNEFDFPTITFCSLQICGFKDYDYSSFLKKYKQDEQEKFGTNQDAAIDNKLRTDNTKTSYFSAKEVFLRKYEDSELMRILNKDKESIKKMLISCRFNGQPCGELDFQYSQMGEFLKCYKFNSGLNFNNVNVAMRKTTRFGENFGLKMELYVGTQDECKSPLSVASGIIMYIHNYTYTLTEEDNAILMRPGTQTNIGLDRTIVRKLPDPYSNCFDTIETYKTKSALILRTINLTSKNFYSQQYCLQLCYQDFLMEFCDC